MPIPEALKQSVDREIVAYCDQKMPLRVRDKVRLVHVWRGEKVTIIEKRPYWRDPIGAPWVEHPVVQFRYHANADAWSIYWHDRNQRWHPYEEHPGCRSIVRLLVEVDQDPTGIFWG